MQIVSIGDDLQEMSNPFFGGGGGRRGGVGGEGGGGEDLASSQVNLLQAFKWPWNS